MQVNSSSLEDDILKKKRRFESCVDLKQQSAGTASKSAFDLNDLANNNNNNNNNKRRKSAATLANELSSSLLLHHRTRTAASSPSLLETAASESPTKKTLTNATFPSCSSSSSYHQNEQFHNNNVPGGDVIVKPSSYMMTTLQAQGHYVRSRPSVSMPDGFFVSSKTKNSKTNNETKHIIDAIRSRDFDTLRKIWKKEKNGGGGSSSSCSFSCCCSNRFGESILHLACRHGYTDIVQFLLEEVKLSLHVIDDSGRTPLHDSMWSPGEPNFELVELIIGRAPELLFLSDKRGNLPLDYVGKEYYNKWIKFIDERPLETFIPKDERMKKLFVMTGLSTVQANKINTVIQMNYLDILRCGGGNNNNNNKASSSPTALLLKQQRGAL